MTLGLDQAPSMFNPKPSNSKHVTNLQAVVLSKPDTFNLKPPTVFEAKSRPLAQCCVSPFPPCPPAALKFRPGPVHAVSTRGHTCTCRKFPAGLDGKIEVQMVQGPKFNHSTLTTQS